MTNHIFSVVIPVYYRPNYPHPRFKWFNRAVTSVINQTYQDFQVVAVDDGSTPPLSEVFPKHSKVKVVTMERNLGRLAARTKGMEEADGEWICWLDSDDTYLPIYLECINEAINKWPDYKVFNFGAILIHKDYGISIRPTFCPKELEVGHEPFASGKIGAGSFVFHRSVFEDVGGLPTLGLWDFAEFGKQQFPELRNFYPGGKEFGNPWGEDFFMFYKITRKYHSKPLNTALYVQLGKEGHQFREEK